MFGRSSMSKLLGVIFILSIGLRLTAQTDTLMQRFTYPTEAAKPGIWWFWGESVITRYGITKDLEAIKAAGFGGVVVYEQVFKDDPAALKSLSPEWLSMFRFAAGECARLGLWLKVNSGNGYVAGGPWITPELGMQRLVFSDTTIEGGRNISLSLPKPPSKLGFYKDVELIAFPALQGWELPKPRVSSKPKIEELQGMFIDSQPRRIPVNQLPKGGHQYIILDYGKSVDIRSITYAVSASSKALVIATQTPGNWGRDYLGEEMKPIEPIGELEFSMDGASWNRVCALPGRGTQFESWDKRTLSFPTVKARYFRLNLHDWDGKLMMRNICLSGEARLNNWEIKSGNVVDFPERDTSKYNTGEFIDRNRMIRLTGQMDMTTGHLTWTAPAGRWTILRLGHTATGAKTKHGRPEALGLECDKLSKQAARVQFNNYVGVLLKAISEDSGSKIQGVNMDSGEFGSQNWTEEFPAAFAAKNGYAIWQFLPAMAGYVVDNAQVSNKFLLDLRRTIADLMTENYYGTFQDLCHENGLDFMAEAPGIATCMPSDNITAKSRTDIPMGEFWMTQKHGTMDSKEAASAAHLYNRQVISTEAFTGSMADATPAMMKPLADAALALGVNQFNVLA